MSEKNKILDYFLRCAPDNEVHYFYDLLKKAVEITLFKNGGELDSYVDVHLNRFWNYVLNFIEEDKSKGLVPVFQIEDYYLKTVSWFTRYNFDKYNKKKPLLKARPLILRQIDKLDCRKFEALSCVLCKLLGANNTYLTPSGNEAGIDFVASISFSHNAHYLFGVNGPLRIIGQCKKYSSRVQVNSIKEFNSTLLDIYSLTEKVRGILPSWFIGSKGPIIGWVISHSGFQSGATSRAKNYGIITSDSRDLAEVISCSRRFYPLMSQEERALGLIYDVNQILSSEKIRSAN